MNLVVAHSRRCSVPRIHRVGFSSSCCSSGPFGWTTRLFWHPRPYRCEAAPLKIGKSMSSCFSRAQDDCVVVVAAAVVNTKLDTIATFQVSLPDKEQVMKYATIGCSLYMIGSLTFFAHIVCLLSSDGMLGGSKRAFFESGFDCWEKKTC